MTPKDEKSLIDILEKEVDVYERVLRIKSREQEALIDFATPELEACTLEQDALAREGAELEYRRRALVRKMAAGRDTPSEDPTLRETIGWLSPGSAHAVAGLRDELEELLHEISRLQDSNAGLIKGANSFIHRLIDSVMARTKQDPFAYGKGGRKANLREPVPGLLDRKA